MTDGFSWPAFVRARASSPTGRREIATVLLGDFMRWSHGLELSATEDRWELRRADDVGRRGPVVELDLAGGSIVAASDGRERTPLTWASLADAQTSREASLRVEEALGLTSPRATPRSTPAALAFKTASELVRQSPALPGQSRLTVITSADRGVEIEISGITVSSAGLARVGDSSSDLMSAYDGEQRDVGRLAQVLARPRGHLFVGHSRLETVASTAVVIPTDAAFSVGGHWKLAAGVPEGVAWRDIRPSGWGRGSVEPLQLRGESTVSTDRPNVWVIDSIAWTPEEVGEVAAAAVDTIVSRSEAELREKASGAGLRLPLIALPMLGSGHGAHGADRGRLAKALIEALTAVAERSAVDIVIVTTSSADYSVLQGLRRNELESGAAARFLGPSLLSSARELGRRIADREVALFFGAGLSMGAGLPSWSQLLRALLDDLPEGHLTWEEVKDLPVLDQGEVIERAVKDAGEEDIGKRVAAVVGRSDRPSLGHVLLASMQITDAVTTNYDRLYERAVEAAARPDERAIAPLPWAKVSPGAPWVLKMHGDVQHPTSIVLTRGSFVAYDNRWKPVGSVVQALMMTSHLLVVGASLTDDNLIRFAYEVAHLRGQLATNKDARTQSADIGTVIALKPDRAFEHLWSKQFDVVAVGAAPGVLTSDYPSTTRALSIFLDTIAVFASRHAAHLLDARYQIGHPNLVDALRSAYEEASSLGESDEAWKRLAEALASFGAAERDEGPGAVDRGGRGRPQ
ncbi:MAG TPA: hypothetical protein DHV14_06125 [Micrococcales bacterium]|nr:hypothetical protein [Micrococcales bacterium]